MGYYTDRDGQELSLVLDRIHEVPYGAGWEPALTAVSDFLGADLCDLSYIEPETHHCSRWEFVRLDTDCVREYTTNYMTADMATVHPRMPHALQMQEGEIVTDSDLWSQRQRSRMPYFAEFYNRMLNNHNCAFGYARKRGDGSPDVILAAHFRSGDALQRGIRSQLQMLQAHIRRACDAEEKLRQLQRQNSTLADALDRVAEPVVMVDRTGRVMRLNPAAEAIFRAGAPLELSPDRRILLANNGARDAFFRVLAQCGSSQVWTPQSGDLPSKQIQIPRASGRPLVLTLQPLSQELSGAFGAVALLFINDPDTRPKDLRGALRSTYRLTDAEARLTQAVADGETLKAFAGRHDISYETARSQLRKIFEKTGAKRQAELVRIVNKLQ